MVNKLNNKSKVLETILNILDCHVYWKNKQGHYLWCNKKFANVLGLKNENEIIGKTDYDLFTSSLAKEIVTHDKNILNNGVEYQTEETAIDSQNRKAIYLSIKKPIKDELGNTNGLIGVSIDITARKQAEIAKQEFLMNMAHDLRTPLSGIIGLSNLRSKEGASVKDRLYSKWIEDAGDQLLDLLNAVISVTAAEHETESIAKDIVDLHQFAKELQALIQPAVTSKRLSFELKVANHLPRVLADRLQLKRSVLNLLSNAVKFTKQGKISLQINPLSIKKNKIKIEIFITDTGIGIPEDKLDKIFDRFYRAHPSYRAEYKGNGIGLFLVKKAVELLDGEIKVSSEEGKGSCFTVIFTFPMTAEKLEILPTIPKQAPSKLDAAKHAQSILVAEDNTLALHVVQKLLANLGYKITTATNGKTALKSLKRKCFDWALLDIGLPDLDGIEIVKRYRLWEQKNKKSYLPIFCLTAHLKKNIVDNCKEVGFDHVISKPFTEKDLQLIQEFVNKQIISN